MKYTDLSQSIIRKIHEHLNFLKIYSEEIEKPQFPYIFIDFIDYKKEFNTKHREWKSVTFDIRYHPKEFNKNKKAEIIDILERIDEAFCMQGKKVLHVAKLEKNKVVEERWLTIHDTELSIVDNVGHYIFTVGLYDLYGNPYDYELMQDLEIRWDK